MGSQYMNVSHRVAAWSLGIAGSLLLSACGDDSTPQVAVSQEAQAVDIAAQAGGSGVKPQPGRWQVQLKTMDFEMPGVPDDMRKLMRKQMAKGTDTAVCLTQEEADKAERRFFEPHDRECTYENFSMANGQIAGKMTCGEGDAKQAIEVRGSYSATSYDVSLTSQGDMNGQPMNMNMEMTGIRVGECTGDEQK
jgi:hypothetical protein